MNTTHRERVKDSLERWTGVCARKTGYYHLDKKKKKIMTNVYWEMAQKLKGLCRKRETNTAKGMSGDLALHKCLCAPGLQVIWDNLKREQKKLLIHTFLTTITKNSATAISRKGKLPLSIFHRTVISYLKSNTGTTTQSCVTHSWIMCNSLTKFYIVFTFLVPVKTDLLNRTLLSSQL